MYPNSAAFSRAAVFRSVGGYSTENPYACTPGVLPTGSITAIPADDIITGETVTVSDGVAGHTPRVYEFRKDGGPAAPGNVLVAILAGQSANVVAGVLFDAIAAEFFAGRSSIAGNNAAPTINLKSTLRSAVGNIPITDTVTDVDFTHTGMSGGLDEVCEPAVPLLWGPGQRGFLTVPAQAPLL